MVNDWHFLKCSCIRPSMTIHGICCGFLPFHHCGMVFPRALETDCRLLLPPTLPTPFLRPLFLSIFNPTFSPSLFLPFPPCSSLFFHPPPLLFSSISLWSLSLFILFSLLPSPLPPHPPPPSFSPYITPSEALQIRKPGKISSKFITT